ncbi:MAG TPA: hypothetical protein VJN65_07490 [Bacteroidota bacterium]|nr:hypothetical protein [Bacteroidota bacterium]
MDNTSMAFIISIIGLITGLIGLWNKIDDRIEKMQKKDNTTASRQSHTSKRHILSWTNAMRLLSILFIFYAVVKLYSGYLNPPEFNMRAVYEVCFLFSILVFNVIVLYVDSVKDSTGDSLDGIIDILEALWLEAYPMQKGLPKNE